MSGYVTLECATCGRSGETESRYAQIREFALTGKWTNTYCEECAW